MSNLSALAICSPEPLFREGIRRILSQEEHIDLITAVETDGVETWLRQHKPDVLLYDVEFVSDQHLAVLANIKRQCPRMKVVLLLGGCSEDFLVQAIRCGIEGYIVKSSTPGQLIRAIEAIMEGVICVSPHLLDIIVANGKYRPTEKLGPRLASPLTYRESEVGELVSSGLSNREIATKLCISETTVKSHLNEIFKKLHIHHRLQLALHFIRTNRMAS
jgi:DNA-binding NarL/FixJ family response regulator